MKLLLFGSHGQLGSSLERICVERSVTFRAPTHAEVDVADAVAVAALIQDMRPSAVVNATGIVDIRRCEEDPELAFAVNATAVRGLAAACGKVGATLVQTSTHLVFDGKKTAPYVETDLTCPNTIYAASKLAGESLALGHCPNTYVTRFPTLYGARRNAASGFVEKMLAQLRAGAPLRIADDRIDTPTWALDAAGAIIDLLERRADFGIYHIANAGSVSYLDFVRHLASLVGSGSSVSRAKDADFPSSPPKPLRVALGSTRMPPLRTWQSALSAYCSSLAPGTEPSPVAPHEGGTVAARVS